eukprot:1149574-Ditylum_brightwellii.AAC.1
MQLHLSKGTISTSNTPILCGIFQGKSLVSHLLYIDDLKICAKNNAELECLNALVKAFSEEIGMPYGLDKCAILIVSKGEPTTSDILPGIPKLDKTNRRLRNWPPKHTSQGSAKSQPWA